MAYQQDLLFQRAARELERKPDDEDAALFTVRALGQMAGLGYRSCIQGFTDFGATCYAVDALASVRAHRGSLSPEGEALIEGLYAHMSWSDRPPELAEAQDRLLKGDSSGEVHSLLDGAVCELSESFAKDKTGLFGHRGATYYACLHIAWRYYLNPEPAIWPPIPYQTMSTGSSVAWAMMCRSDHDRRTGAKVKEIWQPNFAEPAGDHGANSGKRSLQYSMVRLAVVLGLIFLLLRACVDWRPFLGMGGEERAAQLKHAGASANGSLPTPVPRQGSAVQQRPPRPSEVTAARRGEGIPLTGGVPSGETRPGVSDTPPETARAVELSRTSKLAAEAQQCIARAESHRRSGRYAEAWATCNKFVAEHPGVPEADVLRRWMAEFRTWDVKRLRTLGHNYELNRRNDLARKVYEEALSRYDPKEAVPDLQERLEAIKAADDSGTR